MNLPADTLLQHLCIPQAATEGVAGRKVCTNL
jgi:hypothetical protein